MIQTSHNVVVESKSRRVTVTRTGFTRSVSIARTRRCGGVLSETTFTDDEARELFNSLGEMFKELKRWNG